MSTLVELTEKGVLVRFDPDLGSGVFEQRRLYLLARVPGQIAERIEGTTSDRHLETMPYEQLDALLSEYCEGEELAFSTQFKCMRPLDRGIWTLKTPDVRIFGWFHEKDCFICSAVDAAWRVKEVPLYRGYIDEAVRFRDEIFGPGSGYVAGVEPDDVISNWY
jgi:hypothetical protein